MTFLRVKTTTKVTHTKVFYVGSTPTDVDSGDVSVTITRFDGTSVQAASNATHTTTGTYTFAPNAVALVDAHLMTWSGTLAGAAVQFTDVIDYVGDFYFGLSQAKTAQSIAATYTDAQIAEARIRAEDECERICGQAMVPRFGWQTVYGTGRSRIHVANRALRTVRAVSVDGVAWTQDQLDDLIPTPWGSIRRKAGAIWPADARIRVEFEHGADYPPPEIPPQAMARCKQMLIAPKSGVPDRALSWTTNEGGTYQMSVPSHDKTGDPNVDAVYARWGGRRRGKRSVFA